jgi:transcriptional antiterminator
VPFTEDGVVTKVLHFLIENNLSFSSLCSDSFKDLLKYLNPEIPVLYRTKLKSSLEQLFQFELIKSNQQFEANFQSNGAFSLTFDIWTSRNSHSFFWSCCYFP